MLTEILDAWQFINKVNRINKVNMSVKQFRNLVKISVLRVVQNITAVITMQKNGAGNDMYVHRS